MDPDLHIHKNIQDTPRVTSKQCTYLVSLLHTHTPHLLDFFHIEQHNISCQLIPWLSSMTNFLPFLLQLGLGLTHVDTLLTIAVDPLEVMVGVRSTSLKTLATEIKQLADFAVETRALYWAKTTPIAPERINTTFLLYRI